MDVSRVCLCRSVRCDYPPRDRISLPRCNESSPPINVDMRLLHEHCPNKTDCHHVGHRVLNANIVSKVPVSGDVYTLFTPEALLHSLKQGMQSHNTFRFKIFTPKFSSLTDEILQTHSLFVNLNQRLMMKLHSTLCNYCGVQSLCLARSGDADMRPDLRAPAFHSTQLIDFLLASIDEIFDWCLHLFHDDETRLNSREKLTLRARRSTVWQSSHQRSLWTITINQSPQQQRSSECSHIILNLNAKPGGFVVNLH